MSIFRTQLVSRQRKRIEAACVDMWEPFRLSIEQWAPQCKIVYDKFHIMQHANDAIDEVRQGGILPTRAEEAGTHQREEVVADESLEEPDAGTPRGIEPGVRTQPAGLQSLSVERELRGAVELPIPRGHAQLLEPVDGPTEVAATGSVRETRGDAA